MFEVCERLVSILCSFRSYFTGWRDFRMTLIMVSVGVRYLFYQPIDEKIKKWPLHFPVRENPNKEEALINWPIVLRYDVKAKYRLISRKFFGHEVFSPERSLNQPKATRVCIRSINHSNRSFFVRLFFCFVYAFSCQGHTKIPLSFHVGTKSYPALCTLYNQGDNTTPRL